jgi:hypothetical protein
MIIRSFDVRLAGQAVVYMANLPLEVNIQNQVSSADLLRAHVLDDFGNDYAVHRSGMIQMECRCMHNCHTHTYAACKNTDPLLSLAY